MAAFVAKQLAGAEVIDANKSIVALMLYLDSDIEIVLLMFGMIEDDTINNAAAD